MSDTDERPGVDVERLHELLPMVWCRTCEHTHIPAIQTVTFRCADCGFGAWDLGVAGDHAATLPDHIVYPLHHQTVPLGEQDEDDVRRAALREAAGIALRCADTTEDYIKDKGCRWVAREIESVIAREAGSA